MSFIWFFYYVLIFLTGYAIWNFLKNTLLRFFLIPLVFGIFGSIWFIEPGSNNFAPIISILFLENTILDSNGIDRLLRPLFAFILFFQFLSFFIYFFKRKS